MSYAKNFQTVEEAKPDYAVAGQPVYIHANDHRTNNRQQRGSKMTDLLTKEERETVESIRQVIADDHIRNDEENCETLLAIIDNLSKRGAKKYSEEELRNFAKDSGISYQYFSAYFEGVVDFARFLGALDAIVNEEV